MDLVEPDTNHSHIEDESNPPSASSNSSDICDVFGDPEEPPRLGENYQAAIPPLMTGYDVHCSEKQNDASLFVGTTDPHYFLIGLDMPLMWVDKEYNYYNCKSDFSETCSVKKSIKIQECESEVLGVRDEKCGEYKGKRSCNLVPGSPDEEWSEIEEGSFVLGLYIFGKNLVEVKKLVGSKTMGNILSFYYGKFYGSKEYHRWSECRKLKGKRRVLGPKIFTGLRQHELLSRLLPQLSVECQQRLVEVSKTFGEGKILVAEYATSLKCIAGMPSFIEAVGIGKGKQDLTGVCWGESVKANQSVDMAFSKSCSSLTHEEIVKLLTGGIRLSKTRSRDIFWEAVWPRLLARGWNSEQPRNRGYGSNPLVFLVPGVSKFSRRKLVKGTHYFDSITDVLSKVSSDSGLLELKDDCEMKATMDRDDNTACNQPRHCYLQPKTHNNHGSAIKFTVVDTSLGNGIRELRCLPSPSTNESRNLRPEDIGSWDSDSSDTNTKTTSSCDLDLQATGSKDFECSSTNGVVVSIPVGDISPEACEIQGSKERNNMNRSDCMDPFAGRLHNFAACTNYGSIEKDPCLWSDDPDSCETIDPIATSSHLCNGRKEKPLLANTFDLNLPHVPQVDELIKNGEFDDKNNVPPDQAWPRRQSMRSRPLTTRALEALECGFLSPKRSRKNTEDASESKPLKTLVPGFRLVSRKTSTDLGG